MADDVARLASVRGRVQGVFFRASTVERAEQLGVAGWVRNEPDGTVTIHAEGTPAAVDELLSWAHDGPRSARVVGVDVETVQPAGYDDFVVHGDW